MAWTINEWDLSNESIFKIVSLPVVLEIDFVILIIEKRPFISKIFCSGDPLTIVSFPRGYFNISITSYYYVFVKHFIVV